MQSGDEPRTILVSRVGDDRAMRSPWNVNRSSAIRRLVFFGLTLAAVGCSRAPITNRYQLNAVPDPLMVDLGSTAYREMLSGETVASDTADAQTLKNVGKRISRIARKPNYRWRYALIDDDENINAWCLPGGKIAFYTGILPVLENEAGMGFVMGHEVGHAMAHHSAERLTQQATVLGGMTALYLYLDKNSEMPDKAKDILLAALGLGLEVGVLLPFSRKHEKEADVIGMMYMARAGYPPEESINVWTRMRREAGKSALPSFLSTHPNHNARKQNLREWLPSAKKRYARNKTDRDTLKKVWSPKD